MLKLGMILAGASLSLQAVAAVPSAVPVFTQKAIEKPIFNILTYPARVESQVNAVVRSEAEGAVTEIMKPLGSRVRRGEKIAIIKHMDPVYEYAPLAVVAPVSGVVNDVLVTKGSLVNKGDAIVNITDPDHLRVMIDVAAHDLKTVKAGLKGEFTVPGGGAQSLVANVKGVSPSIDPMLGTAPCELRVNEKEQKQIIAGMVGTVQFKVNQRQGFMLPDHAIVYKGDEAFVRLVQEGKSNRVPVKLGEKRQGEVEILSGLKSGDEVVSRASRFVPDGASVQVETAQ